MSDGDLGERLKAFARDCVLHGDMTPGAEQQLHHILDNTAARKRQLMDEGVKPTLSEVRDLIATMVEVDSKGWIGEGIDIANELLAYIDGNSPNSPGEWKSGMDGWAYVVHPDDPGQQRGPFDSYQKASSFLASMPEHATEVSPIGRTCDRDSYVVLTRAELAAHLSGRGRVRCPCDCFECSVGRHDICRHVIKCRQRPRRLEVYDD